MSTNRSRRIDRDTAEQLLGGAVGGPSAGQDASLAGPDIGAGSTGLPEGGPVDRVARVLAAASAPAVAEELSGEEAALAAFREARLAPVPAVTAVPAPVRRRSMATAALARAFSTKAVAVVLGATALGGVAVAAGTGNLPSPLGGGSEDRGRLPVAPAATGTSAPGTKSGPSGGSSAARQPFGGPSAAGGAATGGPSTGAGRQSAPGAPSSTPANGETKGGPNGLAPLCRGFTDRTGKGERPRLLTADPQFAALVAAAGGADKVEEYCANVLRRAGEDDRRGNSPQSGGTSGNGGNGAGGNQDGKRDGSQKGDQPGDGGKTPGGSGSGGNGGKATGTPELPPLPTLTDPRPKPDRTDKPAEASPKR
ncbi:hypothetical protein RMN57_18310 [Kitasatospora sp. CM 4170]|uniref:Uncharacterized protein n=1 Tax=Kitasatospora aburaviensis TaxID=67265 RepID=A0ABW1F534_9ACTN|nr:hypothetical protein [Kitasatospora sp. CM 4170]WNM46518.1 hypothetical protein RMN57_18310 [Kitasatospora sp. CM 4170]